MFFRPLPVLTAVCALLFAFLIGLGAWQLQRLQWKLTLIHFVNRNMHQRPLALGDDGHLVWEQWTNYLHVKATGRFDNTKEAYVYGIGPDGPVFHVIVPFRTTTGQMYLVDRGIVPRERKDPATRRDGIRNGVSTVVGIWRWAEAPGAFTPEPNLMQRVWYSKDAASIARADRISLWEPPGLIEADATPNPGGWPKGGQTVVAFRNEHLQYALTWFLMAAGLLGVYLAYHVSRGRLGLKRKD